MKNTSLISGCSAVDVPMTSYGAPDEHPMSTRSASDGGRWNSRGWKYVACLLLVLFVGVGNAWGAVLWESDMQSSIDGVSQTKGNNSDSWSTSLSLNWAAGYTKAYYINNSSNRYLTLSYNTSLDLKKGNTIRIYAGQNGSSTVRTLSLFLNGGASAVTTKNLAQNTLTVLEYELPSDLELSSLKILTSNTATYVFKIVIFGEKPSIGETTISYLFTYKNTGAQGLTNNAISTISAFSTELAGTGLSVGTSNGIDGLSGQITNIQTAYSDSRYVDLQFTIADGYTFSPSSFSFKWAGNNTNLKAKVAVFDGSTTALSDESQITNSTPSAANTKSFTFTENPLIGKTFEGTIHIRVYVYGTNNQRAYLLSPLTLTGTVASSGGGGDPEPSCEATAEAGENKATTVGIGVAMAATAASSGFTGAWSIKAGSPSTATSQLGTTSSNTMTFTPNTYGTYTLVWTVTDDSDGSCSATDEATVTVPAPTHAITYTNTKGAVNTNPDTYTEGAGIASFAKLRHVVGYDFSGWSPASISSSATTNQTIEAQWTAKAVAEGTGSLTYALAFGSGSLTTSSITRVNGALYDATDVSLANTSFADNTNKTGCSGKLTTTTAKGGYVEVTFKIAEGYSFTPTEVRVQGIAVTTSKTIEVELTDNADTPNSKSVSGTLTAVNSPTTGGYTVTLDFDESDPVVLEGTVTAKIYAYGANDHWRMGTPLVITGTLASTTPASGHAITTSATNGTIAVTDGTDAITSAEAGDEVSIAATPATGYGFTSWDVYKTSDATTKVSLLTDDDSDNKTRKFSMPAYAVTVGATFTAINYTVTHSAATNGSYTIKVGDAEAVSTNTTANYGQTVTLAATPASGYGFAGWTVMQGETPVSVTNNTFTMPAGNVTVTVSFEAIPCPTSGTVFAYTSKTGISNVDINAGTYTYTPANPGSYLTSVTGGKAVMYVPSDGNMRIRGSQLAFNSGNSYIKIELDCELKVGDTILVNSSGNTNDLWIGLSTSRPENAEAAAAVIKQGTGYVVAAESALDDNIKNLYFWRNSNTTQIGNVSILRPAKYAMTFVKGDEDATGEMAAQSVIEKSLVTLPACTFGAPEGKEFDAWVVTKTAGGASVTVTDGKFTMPQEAVTLTATWKAIVPKYAVTYVLNGPTGDAPTETNKAEDAEFSLAAAPSWAGHVFKGWQWTDGEEVTHLEAAASSFTMPAYAVTFTAQWRLDPQATMSNAQYVIGGSALDMATKFESLNTESSVTFSLKEEYVGASITEAGSFSATAAGEYIVVANQAGNASYEEAEVEATVEVLESELEETYVWKKSAYTGSCVESPNADAPAAQYTNVTVDGMASVASGRPAEAGDVTITLAINNAYSSLFGIKSVCAYGKIEETAGIEYSWNNTDWTPMAGGESGDSQHEFTAPASSFPTSLYIRFTNVETGKKGVWFRNALVTLERKKAIVSTDIDLTDVKINGTSISSEDLATLKTADAYALDITDEFVTAPTVKFNKHTVITYEDDSEVEKDDVITETADVNSSGKWEASAEIDAITYTVTMAKADAFVVHYYEADGETLIGSENVAVSGHPTAAGITPTPQDYKRVVWKLNDEPVDLENVTSDVAGTEITLVASYVDAYARSINIEQWVLDNGKKNTEFRAVLDERNYKYSNINELDSLQGGDKNDGDRNYPFLGQKWKLATSEISFLLKEGLTVKVRFGNMGSSVNVKIGSADAVELTSGSYANTSVSSSKEYSYTATEDVVVKFQGTGTGTVVFKQIMIDEAIASVTLPAIVTYDANGGSFGKTSEKYTGTPLVIGDATPADEDYEFEGWHLGTVEGEKINAAAYSPTKNVTLVAKYVAKPSPFSLTALTYQIGSGAATAVGYVEGTYEYDVELPYAPSYDAITVAYTLMDGTSSEKSGAVLSVTSVPGAATFTIVAANETEKTYTVNFAKAAKDGLSIIKATISGGDESAGFDATGLYAGKGYAKTASKKLNSNNYVGVQLKEGQSFQAGDKLFVVTSTAADRGYIELYQEAAGTNLIKALGVRDASAGIALPSEAYGLNEIYIVRKASEGDQSWNGTVNYVEVTRPMNPVLKSITFDGTKIDVTGLTVEETLPYSADLTAVTPEIFWNGAGTAVVTTNEGAWAWGENTYVLTDKDDDATTYAITLVRAAQSSDATLSSLSVNGNAVDLASGKEVDGVMTYKYELPYGTADAPTVAAAANNAYATLGDITQAVSASGIATFTVTAEDESTQDYAVKFYVSRAQSLAIYDGKTSDPMSSIANPGSLTPGLEWTITGASTTSAGSASALTFEGKSYTKYVNLFGSATSNTRNMSITIPDGYLAKFRLVGCSNNSSVSSLFISKEITGEVDESIAFVTASTSALGGMTSDLQLPGTYYLCCNASIRIYELSVTLYPIDYPRDVTPKTYGTICLPNGGIMVGGTLFEVAYMTYENVQPYKVFFDEVIDGIMEPAVPYIFLPKEDASLVAVTYTDNANATPSVEGVHGLHGTLEQMNGEDLYGKYIFYNNSIFKSENPNNWLNANRAYIELSQVPDYVTPIASNRRRVSMGFNGTNTATGMENINASEKPVKLMINGQIYILRGEKMYDVTGKLVK